MAYRSVGMVLVTLVAAAACSGGSGEEPRSATGGDSPAEGVPCQVAGEQTGIYNGTLRCEREGDQLVWRLVGTEAPETTAGSNGVEGTPCSVVGETTGLPNGTAECVVENGSFVWRRIGGPVPVLPDGVTCGSIANPVNPLALSGDNDNVRASLNAFPVECVFPRLVACAPEADQEQYQWLRTDHNLAIDPRNPSRLLVGIERLGLFESRDRGETWAPLSEEGVLHSMATTDDTVCWTQTFDILFDPAVPGRIYLNHGGGGTVESGIWQSRGSGLYRSDDDGRTWDLLTAPDMNTYVAGITIDPTSSDTIYYGTSSAPQTDGSAPTAYVKDGLVYRSDDAGETWRELPTGWGARTVGSKIVVDPANPQSLLLGVFQYKDGAAGGAPTGTGLGPGWYRSTDGGQTWAPHGLGEGATTPVRISAAASADGSTLITWFDTMWVSDDGGLTWRGIEPLRWAPVIDPHGDGRRIYAILSAEYARTDLDQFTVSEDLGRTWTTLGELPPEMRINEFNEPPLYRRATPSEVVVDPTDPNIIYVTGAGGTIARSVDGGVNWQLLATWETFPASTARIR